MKRTEQEQRLETALFELIKNAGNMLRVEFISNDRSYRDSRDGEKIKSIAYKQEGQVLLTLVEPVVPIELDQWAEAIVKAEELVGMVEMERAYEYQNPNYFKSITAKFRYLK